MGVLESNIRHDIFPVGLCILTVLFLSSIVAFDIHISKLFIYHFIALEYLCQMYKILLLSEFMKEVSHFIYFMFHIFKSLPHLEFIFVQAWIQLLLLFLPELNIVVSKYICRIPHLTASDLKSCIGFAVHILFYFIYLCLHSFQNLSLYAMTNMLGKGLLIVFPFQNLSFMNLYVIFPFSWSK